MTGTITLKLTEEEATNLRTLARGAGAAMGTDEAAVFGAQLLVKIHEAIASSKEVASESNDNVSVTSPEKAKRNGREARANG